MTFGAKHDDSASKKIKLYCHLSRHGRIDDGSYFMSRKYSEWVVPKISDRYKPSL